MEEIKITDEMKTRAYNKILDWQTYRKKKLPAQKRRDIYLGELGEQAVRSICPSDTKWVDRADFDFTLNGKRYDVKTSWTRTQPRPDFHCSVPDRCRTKGLDSFVFVMVAENESVAWICGQLEFYEFFKRASKQGIWHRVKVEDLKPFDFPRKGKTMSEHNSQPVNSVKSHFLMTFDEVKSILGDSGLTRTNIGIREVKIGKSIRYFASDISDLIKKVKPSLYAIFVSYVHVRNHLLNSRQKYVLDQHKDLEDSEMIAERLSISAASVNDLARAEILPYTTKELIPAGEKSLPKTRYFFQWAGSVFPALEKLYTEVNLSKKVLTLQNQSTIKVQQAQIEKLTKMVEELSKKIDPGLKSTTESV